MCPWLHPQRHVSPSLLVFLFLSPGIQPLLTQCVFISPCWCLPLCFLPHLTICENNKNSSLFQGWPIWDSFKWLKECVQTQLHIHSALQKLLLYSPQHTLNKRKLLVIFNQKSLFSSATCTPESWFGTSEALACSLLEDTNDSQFRFFWWQLIFCKR